MTARPESALDCATLIPAKLTTRSRWSGRTGTLPRNYEIYAEDAELFPPKRPSLSLVRERHRASHSADFRPRGANVVCADIDEKRAGETAAEVNRKGSKALAIKVDVTKRIEVAEWRNAQLQLSATSFLFNSAAPPSAAPNFSRSTIP